MNKTQIEWVKNPDGSQGYTWNPITGCLNGCEYCYARKLANGRLSSLYLSNLDIPNLIGWNDHPYKKEGIAEKLLDPFYPRFWTHRLWQMVWQQKTKPKGIFVCDMGELFGDWVPKEWQKKVFDAIAVNPQHRFYLLTKQPQNLIKWSPFPDNCWVGVSATDRNMALVAYHHLKNVEAKVKYLSLEPLLEWNLYTNIAFMTELDAAGIGWIIIGSQTKPYKPPKIEWVKEIVKACDKAGIPVFLKDNLHPVLSKETATMFHRAYPEYCELRQEMPV